jgi:hypothetical protein
MGILVEYSQRDRGAGSLTFKDSGEDLYPIRLLAGTGGRTTAAGTPPIQVFLNVFKRKGQSGRATIDRRPYRGAMRFSPGCHPEYSAKGTTGHFITLPN